MKIFRSFESAEGILNPVVTTGSFDGVHVGHKTILRRLRTLADTHDGESVLITFHPHPRIVLYPETAGRNLKLINSQEEKLELLRKTSLDNVIIIEFTREFSKVTSEQFVREYLHNILKARVVVAGFNHHFGFNKEGDYKQLWDLRGKYNFDAIEIPEQEVQHETVSSTRIRQAISEGYIQRANAYLDHYYIIMGTPVSHSTGSPGQLPPLLRVPLSEDCKLLPACGVYAVSIEKSGICSKGMAVIHSTSATTNEVLVHVFEDHDKYKGENSILSFHKKIHGTINLADSRTQYILDAAISEISELIY
ncbi:MAG: adenylyltransferase/cytidyltransferase family protein [Bacteroidales bacterium]|nr:adenylyltransferase/cytidyltransferase family protein [Bacteroidales bacterium]